MAEGGDHPKPVFIRIHDLNSITDFTVADLTGAIKKQINRDEEVYIVQEEQVWKVYLKRKEMRDLLVEEGIQLSCFLEPEVPNIQMYDAFIIKGLPISTSATKIKELLEDHGITYTSTSAIDLAPQPFSNGKLILFISKLQKQILPLIFFFQEFKCYLYHIRLTNIIDCFNTFCWVCNEPNHDPGSVQCRNKSIIVSESHPLSNFYLAEFTMATELFKSAEHAYEYFKAHKHKEHDKAIAIMKSPIASMAKSIGDTIPESQKWKAMKDFTMRIIIEVKISQLPRVLEDFQRASSETEFIVHPDQDFHGENLKLGQLLKEVVANNLLTLGSLNVNGLKDKNGKLIDWIIDREFGIVFLQETHFELGRTFDCLPNLFHNVHCVSNNSASRGVSILVKRSLCDEIPKRNLYKSEDGRTLKVNFMHKKKTNLTLICVYAHNNTKDRIVYFWRLLELIKKERKKCQSIIICGDFNCDLDDESDKSTETLKCVINECCLIDAWRHLKGNEQGHTYVRGTSRRRIDYVFLTEKLIFSPSNDLPDESTKTLPFPLSDIYLHESDIGDHKEIYVELNTITEIPHPIPRPS